MIRPRPPQGSIDIRRFAVFGVVRCDLRLSLIVTASGPFAQCPSLLSVSSLTSYVFGRDRTRVGAGIDSALPLPREAVESSHLSSVGRNNSAV